jgi:hypothetical protein
MAHEIKFGTALCCTPVFVINGINADSDDFGEQYDHYPDSAEDYACGDMKFDTKAPEPCVLQKYKIDELEYWTIANKLAEGLSFGSCGWCV